jgi:hypothetical protein
MRKFISIAKVNYALAVILTVAHALPRTHNGLLGSGMVGIQKGQGKKKAPTIPTFGLVGAEASGEGLSWLSAPIQIREWYLCVVYILTFRVTLLAFVQRSFRYCSGGELDPMRERIGAILNTIITSNAGRSMKDTVN